MRILFVTSRPPWPSRRGDQARVAGLVEELARRHELAVIAQRPPGFPPPAFPPAVRGRDLPLRRSRILPSLWNARRMPLQVAWHYQPELERTVRREIDDFRPDVAVVVLSRLGWVAPALGEVPWVLDLVDSLALNMRHRAARQPLLGALWRWEARRIERWDRRLIPRVARTIVVSNRDREALVAGRDDLAGNIEVLPFGIPLPVSPPRQRGGERVVLLSGNLGYFPTRDGALWLAREVWPRVRRSCPQAQWWLAGSRAVPAIRRLERLPGVRVMADPEDLSAIRRRSAVAVAPMRSGSGTPIKILESMADGLPVVATPEAAAGLDALRGDEVSVAADPRTFAEAVVRLLENPEAAASQVSIAWSWLREHHELCSVSRRFERLLEEAISGPPRERR